MNNTIYKPLDELNIPLPVGTKVYVTYKDTSYGICKRLSTVIEKAGFGICFDNGYGNPIFDVIQYELAE